jgi:hypothetical protein
MVSRQDLPAAIVNAAVFAMMIHLIVLLMVMHQGLIMIHLIVLLMVMNPGLIIIHLIVLLMFMHQGLMTVKAG